VAQLGTWADGDGERRTRRGRSDRYGGNDEELGEKVAVTFEHGERNVVGLGADSDGRI
jgi:hypothetical protein